MGKWLDYINIRTRSDAEQGDRARDRRHSRLTSWRKSGGLSLLDLVLILTVLGVIVTAIVVLNLI